jgi:hypothetical protein
MAGDLSVVERMLIEGVPLESRTGLAARAVPGTAAGDLPIHSYGRLRIVADIRPDAEAQAAAGSQFKASAAALPGRLSMTESMGLAAFELRSSNAYRAAKANRPRANQSWDMGRCTNVVPIPPAVVAAAAARARVTGPTSAYLEGSVAVGIVIVEGPTADLKFSAAERTKVVAEVQNGLGFLATSNPVAGITFTYDIHDVTLTVAANPNAPDLEALWRDPTMAMLGFTPDWAGVAAYVEDLRTRFGTRWTYCAFFTKYPLFHFAYAGIGGPRLVMQYANDGWGPDNIDRVFAHETGHIFGAPDEYTSSGCNCGGAWGRFGLPNLNCESCAAGGGVPCLMRANTFALCDYTPGHLGWKNPQLVLGSFGYDAGGWRVDRHPRLMADTTGDGKADIVGFGNAGVWRSPATVIGRFDPPTLVLNSFGYDAGGWRVERHPRFLADTTGDGRADIVGFGNAGVWVSQAQPGGGFAPPTLVVNSFGYDAGGWRVEQHPRFLADVTAEGRADIIGFGNAGVWYCRS